MIKFSDHLLNLDEKMRFFAKAAHNQLMDILYPSDRPRVGEKRRKMDKKLMKLITYLEQIDSLGYQLQIDIWSKKEVMNGVNHMLNKPRRKKRKGGRK